MIEVGDITANNPFTGIREGMIRPAQVIHGATAGNIVQVDMSRLQVSGNVEISEEQGKTMASIPITALPNVGNDEVVFTSK